MKFIIVNDDRGLGKLWAASMQQAGHKALFFEEPKEFALAALKDDGICENLDGILLDRFYGQGFDLGNDGPLLSELRQLTNGARFILFSKMHGDADEPSTLPTGRFDDILYPLPVNIERLLFKMTNRS